MHGWHGNALALARAWAYILGNGADGLRKVSEAAVLNANWLLAQLRGTYRIPYDRPAMHEVVVSTHGAPGTAHELRALDVGKRLLEKGFHAPTVYFPLVVQEALMIEPTETESPETVAAIAAALGRDSPREPRDGGGRPPDHTDRSCRRGPRGPLARADLGRDQPRLNCRLSGTACAAPGTGIGVPLTLTATSGGSPTRSHAGPVTEDCWPASRIPS